MKTQNTGLPQTLADVAKAVNIDLNAVTSGIRHLPLPEDDQQYMIDTFIWSKIIEAVNQGKEVTFRNENRKHFPYAWVKVDTTDPSGFGFTYTYTLWTDASTCVGVRLMTAEEDAAAYALKQFPAQFKAAFLRERKVTA